LLCRVADYLDRHPDVKKIIKQPEGNQEQRYSFFLKNLSVIFAALGKRKMFVLQR
jgi:hypothetical protein